MSPTVAFIVKFDYPKSVTGYRKKRANEQTDKQTDAEQSDSYLSLV